MNEYRTIVIGGGVIGSAAAYWLARRGGGGVLLLEQYAFGHDRGASDDHSRVIRHSYHSDDYGRLTRASYRNWRELESESGQALLTVTGGIDIALAGSPGVESVLGYREVLTSNGHAFDELDRKALLERFPQWEIDEEVVATYQHESGIVDVRRATQVQIALAELHGATVADHRRVERIDSAANGVRVVIDGDTLTADQVVVATASWSDELLEPLGQTWRTTISQEQVLYVATPRLRDFAVGVFPLWVWHGETMFYGFPTYGEAAIKIARDVTGRFVTQATRGFEPIPEETDLLLAFLAQRLPAALGRVLLDKTCVYDLAPDRDFVLDRMPGHPRVIVASGGGHAAKFANLLGEIVAELALDGRSRHPIGAFRADRPGLTDPAFVPRFSLTA